MPDEPLDVLALARAHKAAVNAADSAALQQQTTAYQGVISAINAAIIRMLDERDASQESGVEDIGMGWLFRRNRLLTLLAQATAEINRYGAMAAQHVAEYQHQAATLAESHMLEAVEAQIAEGERAQILAGWNKLPTEAITHLIGVMADGTPLAARFAQLAPTAVPQIRQAIVTGFAIGQGGRQIAANVARAGDVALNDALRITRTEPLRAYRTVASDTMQANSSLIVGWRWTASRSVRTCAACLAMDGTEHPVDEPMASHVCCRCVQTPITKLAAEEGKPSKYGTSEEWLKRQSEERQNAILGSKAAGDAFRAGTVSLADFVGVKDNPTWGKSVYVRTLKSIQAASVDD